MTSSGASAPSEGVSKPGTQVRDANILLFPDSDSDRGKRSKLKLVICMLLGSQNAYMYKLQIIKSYLPKNIKYSFRFKYGFVSGAELGHEILMRFLIRDTNYHLTITFHLQYLH